MSIVEIKARTTGKYLRSLNSSRTEVIELTFEEAVRLAKNGAVLFEVLEEGEHYIPFTDCDHYCDTIERPPDDYIDDVKEKMMNNLGYLVNDQFDEEQHRFGMATRHGVHVEKKVYKLSWRCYFFGFVIKMSELKKVIVRKRLDKAGVGSLDSSPYNKNQLLGCVGFCKSKKDRRVLKPCGDWPLEKFMVQNITGDETILTYDDLDQDVENDSVDIDDGNYNFEGSRFAPPWEIFELLVMNLNVELRCEKGRYQPWARIGWAIAGVARAAKRYEDGLGLWLRFCRQCMSAYLEDPMKARLVYLNAKKQDHQLGWSSLMAALREDNSTVYDEIRGKLASGNTWAITDDNQVGVIRDFLRTKLSCKPNRISGIFIKEYEDRKVIVIDTTETYCSIKEDEHSDSEIPLTYYIIASRNAKEKCRHPECRDKSGMTVPAENYGEALKKVVEDLLSGDISTEKAIQNLLQHTFKGDKLLQKMNYEIGERVVCDFSLDRFELTENRFCPIHDCYHEHPENCLILSKNSQRMGIKCRQDAFSYYPPDGLLVPPKIVNVINRGIIVHNHFTTGTDAGIDGLFDDLLPIFKDAELNRLMHLSFKGYASDVAQVFYYLGHCRFGVQSGESDTWWAWDTEEMRWIQSSHKANLFCDGELAGKYQLAASWYKNNTPDNDIRIRRLKQIDYLLKRLKDRDQHSILVQAAIIFKDKKRQFENRLDSNKDIINFRGQVFDFARLELRDVCSSDYVSKTTGYVLPEYSCERETAIMDFVGSIMPDAAHVEYLLTWLASCIDGWNREETFTILSGSGRNGKSLLRDLLASALGETAIGYFGVVAASLLTKERPSSDRPVADLLHMKGKRLLIASEPEKGSKINCGFLKFLTGNDPINGRWLSSNAEITFYPQHSLALLCNSIPNLDASDEAVWDRSRVLNFPFKFVSRPTLEHHRKGNPFLKSTLPGLGPHFMLILLKYYEKYRRHGLEPTPEMLSHTQDIRTENDIYGEFFDENLVITTNDLDRLAWNRIVQRCETWLNSHIVYHGLKLDQKETTKLKDAVTARMGRSDSTQGDLLNKVKGKKGPPKFKGWSRLKLVELDAENVAPPVYLDD